MGIVFLGPPGVGKGTQCRRLVQHLGAAHISTGDMLRAAVQSGTTVGQKVASTLESGKLVGDELMIELVCQRLQEPDARERFLLDGFPRTISQATALDEFLATRNQAIKAVILLVAPDEELQQRMIVRAEQEGRADDTPDTIAQRLEVYRRRTQPLVGFYEQQAKLHRVDGLGTMDEVFQRICDILPPCQKKSAD